MHHIKRVAAHPQGARQLFDRAGLSELMARARAVLLMADMKCRCAVLAVFFFLFGLAGCATSPQATTLPPPVALAKPASLDFIRVDATSTVPNLPAETTQLKNAILSGLRETGLFANVDTARPKDVSAAGIEVRAAIKQIRQVSKHARVWYGGLAGRAQVLVHVSISDLNSAKPIEEFEVEGQTGASAWAGLTDEAIQRAAAQIVDEIKRLDVQAAQNALDQF